MRFAAMCTTVISLSLFGLKAYAGEPYPAAVGANGSAQPAVASQSAPGARITVIDARSELRPQSPSVGRATTATVPTARLTIVDDTRVTPATEPEPDVRIPVAAQRSDAESRQMADADDADSGTIETELAPIAGTWKAVGRSGDGELTTVELQLDNRGWAKLILPGPDGKPSTIERRAELRDQELKLRGSDADVVLGKLLEVNSRQMVLARGEGQLTFVRPQ